MKHLELNDSVFLLFYGRDLLETGESYCPDTVDALPIIYKALNQAAQDSTVITVIVDRKSDSGSPTNVYRTRPDIKLTAVPTLCVLRSTGITSRLVETECFDFEDVLRFVSNRE
ncbi:hypothetical protein BB560_005973 [Smittium megazygosporum]|uniref:Thioredoxin domain-containing protein n=1 Tax=Smittium megazygosporum TaxID=133381 RepID=A0A2T9YNG6_9FUNG|nr:hypothetical protein BB560_005973 [Smittium megazygosporum]